MSLLRLDPRLDGHHGGVVVVTRFECPQAWMLVWLRWQHRRVAISAARHCGGFLGAAFTTSRRDRTAFSATLWRGADDLYDMGQVPEHIDVVRRTGRLRIRANAAVFPYLDHWSNVMFGSHLHVPSPLGGDATAPGRAGRPAAGAGADEVARGDDVTT